VYLHIGTDVLIRTTEMIAIIGRKGQFPESKINEHFLRAMEKEEKVIDISSKNAKSFILTNDDGVYISPISPQTLFKRSKKFGLSGGVKKID
jgi:regulator of extracellular matrix RemA (YlzA/DUF370 family)